MRPVLIAWFALLVPAAVWACRPAHVATAGAWSADDDVNRGAEIAWAICSRCHSIGAHGRSPHAIAPPFGVVAERFPLDYLPQTLRGGPDAGHLGMPSIPLDDTDLEALKAYLKSLRRHPDTEAR